MLSQPIDRAALAAALAGAWQGSDYERGVCDLLRLLGWLEDGLPPDANEDVRAMLIGSLRAHLEDGVAVGLDWNDLDREGLRGVDLLRAVEAARLAAVGQPAPARVVKAAQAVIRASRGGEDLYLMQWDAHAGRYQPIGGKLAAGDADTAAALRREMMEELGLAAIPGPELCALALLRSGWRTMAVSATYGLLTAYEMDFYAVSGIRFPIRVDADTRWLTFTEIAGQMAADGRAVSPVYAEGLGLDALVRAPVGVVV
jgi:8-oxo-dGTP pyrophosphatase MutT (NUDIX family)